jgi:hypothetical protein
MYRLGLQICACIDRRCSSGRRWWWRWLTGWGRSRRSTSPRSRGISARSCVSLGRVVLVVLRHLARLPLFKLGRVNIVAVGSPVLHVSGARPPRMKRRTNMQCRRPGRWAPGLQKQRQLRRCFHRRGAVVVVHRVAVGAEPLMGEAEHSP